MLNIDGTNQNTPSECSLRFNSTHDYDILELTSLTHELHDFLSIVISEQCAAIVTNNIIKCVLHASKSGKVNEMSNELLFGRMKSDKRTKTVRRNQRETKQLNKITISADQKNQG